MSQSFVIENGCDKAIGLGHPDHDDRDADKENHPVGQSRSRRVDGTPQHHKFGLDRPGSENARTHGR